MKLFIESTQIRLMRDKGEVVTIATSAITEISYGQDVHRRVGAAIERGRDSDWASLVDVVLLLDKGVCTEVFRVAH